MTMDNPPEGEGLKGPGNPSSPMKSSSSSSDVSEHVLWTHSDSSGGSSDELNESAKSLLDFRSPSFSPLLALKCDKSEIVHISKGAKQYLNIHQYSKAVSSPSKSPRKDVAPIKKLSVPQRSEGVPHNEEPKASTSSSSTNPPNFPIPGRRFLPHQLPVYRPRKEHPNVITLMSSMEGPLSVLERVMKEKSRVKIWTRNDEGFRGFLTGFVEAFDKHWNIALRDVDEQFVRKRVIKFPIIGDNISELSLGDEPAIAFSKMTPDAGDNSNNDDNDEKKKEQAISSAFIRLKNYLRLNDGMTRKRMGIGSTANVSSTPTNKNKSSRKNSSSSKEPSISAATKSKTVYVGDMDPLSICRTGLANLSLRDDIHQDERKRQDSSSRSTSSASGRKSSAMMMTSPDIVQCHQRRKSTTAECSSSSTSAATSFPAASTCSTQPHQQHPPNIISRTSLRKKSLTVFKTPYEDSFGFMVVAQTRKYELVERHVGQVLLMGNDIVFIETSSGC